MSVNYILTADKDMIRYVTLKLCIVDERHANSKVLVLIDVGQTSLRHVDTLQQLITVISTRQVALLVHAETTNAHAVVFVT